MYRLLPLIIILSVFTMFGCVNKKINAKNNLHLNDTTYKEIAYSKYGADTLYLFNPARTYILCAKRQNDKLNPNVLTEFFVYSFLDHKIVYEDKLQGAKVSWADNDNLLIEQTRGYITEPQDNGKTSYKYNLKNGKKEIVGKSNK